MLYKDFIAHSNLQRCLQPPNSLYIYWYYIYHSFNNEFCLLIIFIIICCLHYFVLFNNSVNISMIIRDFLILFIFCNTFQRQISNSCQYWMKTSQQLYIPIPVILQFFDDFWASMSIKFPSDMLREIPPNQTWALSLVNIFHLQSEKQTTGKHIHVGRETKLKEITHI